jgi:hypothetical protein
VLTSTNKKVTDVDVLFVVDNSNTMEQEQANLAKNFPRFIEKLEQAQLGYRVGVVSSDLGAGPYSLPSCELTGGDAGKLQTTPRVAGCIPPNDSWIQKIGGASNVPGGDVAGAFSCVARLGVGGCGFEQPLESAFRALDPQSKVNPGFLRPDAALAVVYITDEDDCSAADTSLYDPARQGLTDPLGPLTSFRCFEFGVSCDRNGRQPGPRRSCVPSSGPYLHPLQRYVDQLKQLKPSGEVIVSVISGPSGPVEVGMEGQNPVLRPSCQSTNGVAVPAVRLASLVSAFGPRGSLHNVCGGDFGRALDQLGSLVAERTQTTWCLPFDPADTDPFTPAIDGDCVVVAAQAGKLGACAPGSSAPCYRLEASSTCASSKTVIAVENVAPGTLGDEVYAICLTAVP